MTQKRLHRSKVDRRIAGVCGGLGEYLGTDPTLIRLGFVFLTIFTGFVPGLFFYLLAWIIMPQE